MKPIVQYQTGICGEVDSIKIMLYVTGFCGEFPCYQIIS